MTVVVSNGKAVVVRERKSYPLSTPGRSTTVRGGRSIDFPQLGLSEAYSRIYSSQPWVFALVNKLSRGVARLPLKSYLNIGDDREYLRPRDVEPHPLPTLLHRPHPRGSRFSLVEATVGNVAIYGKALWWKYRPGPGQAPTELWPLDWRWIEMRTGESAPIDYFVYNGPAGRKVFLPDDVVYFSWWSPAGEAGTSPLEPLRQTLALEDAGRRYAVSSFANAARPAGAVTHPKTLDPKQKEELRAELVGANQGPDQAFRIALLDGGLDWKPFSHTAQEAQTIEHRKLNREEVCAVYDVPPPMVHILDKATFSNIDEQHRMLYQDTLGPWLSFIEETVDAQLLSSELAFAGTEVEFDLNEVLKADVAKRAAAYRQLETTLTANERRALENRSKIDHPAADAILVPANMTAIGAGGYELPAGGGGAASDVGAALSAMIDERVSALVDERVAAALEASGDLVPAGV